MHWLSRDEARRSGEHRQAAGPVTAARLIAPIRPHHLRIFVAALALPHGSTGRRYLQIVLRPLPGSLAHHEKIVEKISGRANYAPPPAVSREIGKIIVRFAYFEKCVLEMVWQALGLSEAAGRIAVREPRITERLDMLRDAVGLRRSLGDEELFKSIRVQADLLPQTQHAAHGIWYNHPSGEWHVQLARGSWPKTAEELEFKSKR